MALCTWKTYKYSMCTNNTLSNMILVHIYIFVSHYNKQDKALESKEEDINIYGNSTITGLSMKGQWDFKGIKPVFLI